MGVGILTIAAATYLGCIYYFEGRAPLLDRNPPREAVGEAAAAEARAR